MRSGPVIVGIDGDAGARDAFAVGQRLAELLDASMDVITVSGAAPDALRWTAEQQHASVLVLGATRRRSLARTLRGTARRLLIQAPCPVAVAPVGFADRPEAPLRDIGVGFEPTPEGAEALAVAHRLAARSGGTLRAIGVAAAAVAARTRRPSRPRTVSRGRAPHRPGRARARAGGAPRGRSGDRRRARGRPRRGADLGVARARPPGVRLARARPVARRRARLRDRTADPQRRLSGRDRAATRGSAAPAPPHDAVGGPPAAARVRDPPPIPAGRSTDRRP